MLNGGRTRDNGKGNRADLYFHSYEFTVSFINVDVNFTTTNVKTTKKEMPVLLTELCWGGGCRMGEGVLVVGWGCNPPI